jgi:hypothetical protein
MSKRWLRWREHAYVRDDLQTTWNVLHLFSLCRMSSAEDESYRHVATRSFLTHFAQKLNESLLRYSPTLYSCVLSLSGAIQESFQVHLVGASGQS